MENCSAAAILPHAVSTGAEESGNLLYWRERALPPPLTREEEEYLLQRLSSGDAAVRAMLIERNLRP